MTTFSHLSLAAVLSLLGTDAHALSCGLTARAHPVTALDHAVACTRSYRRARQAHASSDTDTCGTQALRHLLSAVAEALTEFLGRCDTQQSARDCRTLTDSFTRVLGARVAVVNAAAQGATSALNALFTRATRVTCHLARAGGASSEAGRRVGETDSAILEAGTGAEALAAGLFLIG